MHRLSVPIFCLSIVLTSDSLTAQDIPEFPQPAAEHKFLTRFAGQWTVEQEARMAPDQPPVKGKGSIASRMLGGFWVINEFKSNMLGMSVTGVQTIGYSKSRGKYIGTWVDSVTDTLWEYEGKVDETGMILTLEADGPHMSKPGETTKYRDIYEFKSDDEIAVFSKVQSDDGEWVTFMTGTAKRQK